MLTVTLINGIRAEVKGTIPDNRVELRHPFTGEIVTTSVNNIKGIETDGDLQTWERSLLNFWAYVCSRGLHGVGSSAVCVPAPTRYRTQVTAVLRDGTKHDIHPSTAQADHAYVVGLPGKYIEYTDIDRLIVKEVLV